MAVHSLAFVAKLAPWVVVCCPLTHFRSDSDDTDVSKKFPFRENNEEKEVNTYYYLWRPKGRSYNIGYVCSTKLSLLSASAGGLKIIG